MASEPESVIIGQYSGDNKIQDYARSAHDCAKASAQNPGLTAIVDYAKAMNDYMTSVKKLT
jgi:hypothetical protein